MTNCHIYTRISPRPDFAESESPQAQEDICRQYAQQQGWEVVGVYCDRGKSGSDPDREGLMTALCELKKGDVLLAYDIDRLARKQLLAEWIHEQVGRAGAIVDTVNGPAVDDSPMGVFIRQIRQANAEFERAMIAYRTSTMMKAHQKRGRAMGGQPPYGFYRDGRALKKHPRETEVLERVRELRQRGYGYSGISTRLAHEGYTSRSGGKFTKSTIGRIIRRLGCDVS